jgi:hypothetical protein
MINPYTLSEKDLDTYETLTSFGFGPKDISGAFNSNKQKSLEGMLDWLLKAEAKKNSKPVTGVADNKPKLEEKKMCIKPEAADNKISSSQNPPVINIVNVPAVSEIPSEVGKRIRTIINETNGSQAKNSNDIIAELTLLLKGLKFSGEAFNREVLLLCENEKNFVQHASLSKMRNSFYQQLERAFNKKAKKGSNIDINSYEYALLLLWEMKLLSETQMETMKSFYIKFCRKFGMGENELLLKQLEHGSYGNGQGNGNNNINLNGIGNAVGIPVNSIKKNSADNIFKNGVGKKGDDKRKKSSLSSNSDSSSLKDDDQEELLKDIIDKVKPEALQVPPTPVVVIDKQSRKEETKENTMKTNQGHDKENCLICMERTREIVFLPCSHFLTCPLCAPKLSTCPICNKKLEKHLKIYWC